MRVLKDSCGQPIEWFIWSSHGHLDELRLGCKIKYQTETKYEIDHSKSDNSMPCQHQLGWSVLVSVLFEILISFNFRKIGIG